LKVIAGAGRPAGPRLYKSSTKITCDVRQTLPGTAPRGAEVKRTL
jgi:hypothetical protein